ncbi:MAG: hypothetical protein JNJ73_08640 [Hyphomonadaceae bacterium]|nr:hypothetical protein [Hyphomonadaceae bacterium]
MGTLKRLALHVVGFGLVAYFNLAGLKGEISKPYYLSLLAIFCVALIVGWVTYLRSDKDAAHGHDLLLRRTQRIQHSAFVATLLTMSLACAELVLTGRTSVATITPLLWLFLISFTAFVLTGLIAGILQALSVLRASASPSDG